MEKFKNVDLGLVIMRISVGGLMLFHGVSKMGNPGQTIEKMTSALSESGLPGFLSYGVFLGEVIAPILVLIGFRTKIFSLFIMLTMVVAIYARHSLDVFSLSKSGGLGVELQMLYLLGALALMFTGAGKYAVSSKNKWD